MYDGADWPLLGFSCCSSSGVLHTVDRVLAGLPLLPVEAVLQGVVFGQSTNLWPVMLHFLHTTELVVFGADLSIRATALETVFCSSINSVRHCHSVFLG